MRTLRPAALVIALVTALSACSWTQVRGNGQRSGVNPVAPGVTLAAVGDLAPAWTSTDHGALPHEVTIRDGRAVFAGAAALWAIDTATGTDLWHVDRPNGHQSNELIPATTWRSNNTSVVGMNQFWTDSISGTPYFQWLSRLDVLDLATGATVSTRASAAATPPLDVGGWLYLPVDLIIARPRAAGESVIDIHLDAQALDGSGASFTVPLSSPVEPISSLAADRDTLYLRTLTGLRALPARGCGQPVCTPTWQSTYLNASPTGQIAVANGTVFDLASNGMLTAIDAAGCGATSCAPRWQTTSQLAATGFAVASGRVYVTSGARLSVFDAAGCGASTCAPLWTATASGTLTAPSIVNDIVIAGTGDGNLVIWNRAGCGASTCEPAWSQAQGGAVGPVSPIDHALVFTVGGSIRKLEVPRGPT